MKLAQLKMRYLVCMLLVIFLVVSVIAHSFLTGLENLQQQQGAGAAHGRRPMGTPDEYPSLSAPGAAQQLDELRRIKASVNNELRDLEAKRQQLKVDIMNYTQQLSALGAHYERAASELQQLRVGVEQKRIERLDLDQRYTPKLAMPARLLPDAAPMTSTDDAAPPPTSAFYCRLHNCFDYSRCSLTSQFPVYLYDVSRHGLHAQETFVARSISHAFNTSLYSTNDATIACLYVVLLEYSQLPSAQQKLMLEKYLTRLPFWGSDGRNHLLLNLASNHSSFDLFDGANIGRAMVAQASFSSMTYRRDFDVVVPPSLVTSHGDVWDLMLPLVPAKRKHLLSFQGQMPFLFDFNAKSDSTSTRHRGGGGVKRPPLQARSTGSPSGNHTSRRLLSANAEQRVRTPPRTNIQQSISYLVEFEKAIVKALKTMQTEYAMDNFNFEFSCEVRLDGYRSEWSLCDPPTRRHRVLADSTFALILAPLNMSIVTSTLLQVRLSEALRFGAVPVVVGNYVRLPFESLLPWRQAAIVLPKARVTELHFLLRSISDADILAYRRHGRLLWQQHLSSSERLYETLLADVRARLNMPAAPIADEPSPSAFNDSFTPITEEVGQPPAPKLANKFLSCFGVEGCSWFSLHM